jgi:hypothetical protein
MVKQPKESSYVKSSTRINDMKTVYEMRHIQHLYVSIHIVYTLYSYEIQRVFL